MNPQGLHRPASPVYIWKDRHGRLHFLTCKDSKKNTCTCQTNLMTIMACLQPYVILIVSDIGTHLSSCTFKSDVCECRLLGYLDFVKEGDDNIYQRGESVTCCVDNVYNGPTSMPPRGGLIRSHLGFLHVSECNRVLPCQCTRKLFECGYYRIRLSEHGVHLTRCAHSVDGPCVETCECDGVFKQLQQKNTLITSMNALSIDSR